VSDWANTFFPAVMQIEINKFSGEPIMAKVVTQHVNKGARALLKELNVPCHRFKPTVLGQVPTMATGLLAGINADSVKWDKFENPYLVDSNGARISLAAVIVYEDEIFVYNREGKDLQNVNPLPDIIGSVGFGLSSGVFKWPVEMNLLKVKCARFSDFCGVENTDGDGDTDRILNLIVVIELQEIGECKKHFVPIPKVDATMTSKLQAALLDLHAGI